MSELKKSSGIGETRGVIYQFPTGRSRAASSQRGEGQDSAGLTGAARELSYADGLAKAAVDFRAERVSQLKDQIARGAYRPDPLDVAREILKRGL